MFCNQCQQTLGGVACTSVGICGKDKDVQALQENLVYSLKGISAYAYHARELGYTDPEIDAFLAEGLYSTLTNVNFDMDSLFSLSMKAGMVNLKAMDLLKRAHRETFGEMSPARVETGTVEGPGILVTGHDLKALFELLKQTQGTGVNVYTHSEMLPAHAYPVLRAFPHLRGNLGKSWFDQRTLFAEFPGAILGTSNCVLVPRDEYKDRFFTVGIAYLPGVRHIEGYDFSELIEKAKSLPHLKAHKGETILTTGFSDSVILSLKDKLLSLLKEGKIRRIFLVGGCDAPGQVRQYYRDFVARTPSDTIVLTLACGKFRFNDLDLGEIDGIPRLLDMGQCNDAISAINVAKALSEALGCSVNDLPLTLVLSWMEQKAVAILMTLLALGIKGIYLGPTLPAWLTPTLIEKLKATAGIRLTTTVDKDMAEILAAK
ncbi:MAG: hydroxylamine reductase [Candidatus Fermentithermobacillus carboniphilus]|uniref:Hydroxylamine reductase n=1 Tax=Candidatus Fermentithermobacillus carboniphilus TaxID=3085328 RepID=A0AAT9L9T1_9FIRM|nr:MAG: hydroxylamine reductase [Candidatus Fermentithermobacillus carboniphilus]